MYAPNLWKDRLVQPHPSDSSLCTGCLTCMKDKDLLSALLISNYTPPTTPSIRTLRAIHRLKRVPHTYSKINFILSSLSHSRLLTGLISEPAMSALAASEC